MSFHHRTTHPTLRRTLGLWQVTFAGVGIILGAGIYVLLGLASGYAGNAVWLSFLFAALISLFTGLSYAELSTMFHHDASEYEYTRAALGRRFARIVGMMVIMTGVVSAATVALGFGKYFNSLVDIPVLLAALALVVVCSLVNYTGIRQSSFLNIICTLIEFAGLLIILVLGAKYLGRVDYLEMPHGIQGIFRSTALIFFAYMGFETIVKLTEETKKPKKTIPRALLLSIALSSLLYILIALVAVSVLPWQQLSQSSAPLADVAAAALHLPFFPFFILAIIALFSTGNTVLMTLVTTSRLVYGMAEQRSLPSFFSRVTQKTRTPGFAILFLLVVTLAFVLIGDIAFVANLNDIFLFLTFAAVNGVTIILRYTLPTTRRTFSVPLSVGRFPLLSLLGVVTSLFMAGYAFLNLL